MKAFPHIYPSRLLVDYIDTSFAELGWYGLEMLYHLHRINEDINFH